MHDRVRSPARLVVVAMSAVLNPLVPSSHLQAVEDKLRLHATMDAPPSPPASASDFIQYHDSGSSSSASSPSTPSTPTSATTASASHSDQPPEQPSAPPSPQPTVRHAQLLSPAPKKLSTIVTPPSAQRTISDKHSSEERSATRDEPALLHTAPDNGNSLLLPSVNSPLLVHSSVTSSPSPEPLPLSDDLLLDESIQASPSPSPSPSPVPTAASQFASKPSYAEDSFESRQLRLIYKVFHTVCDLFFAVDKDLHNLTDKRQRQSTKQLESGTESLHSTALHARKSIPDTVSPGYGELARRGFDKVLWYLCHEAPDVLRMGEDCSFLDIGSGFGKCVLHAKVRGRVRESVGIEYIPVRHEKAAETLHLLRARFVPGVTDQYSPGSLEEQRATELLAAVDLDGVVLVQGDITDERHHALLYRASHIYMFDVVFSEHTMAKILPAIEQANFALFACYHRPAFLERLGCTQFVCIHQMSMKTTGKQSFTCYFYVKAAAGAKVTRHTQRQWVEAAKDGKAAGEEGEEGGVGGEVGEASVAKKKRRRSKSTSFYTKKGSAHGKKPSRSRKAVQAREEEQQEDEEEEEEEDEEEAEAQRQEEEAEATRKLQEAEKREARERRRSHKRRPSPTDTFAAPVVPVVEKKRREPTPATAEVLARDAFNAAVIKAVAARLVIEAEREARQQRRYALSVMQKLLSEQDQVIPTPETQSAEDEDQAASRAGVDEDDTAPPLPQRTATLITDVHGTDASVEAPAISAPPPTVSVDHTTSQNATHIQKTSSISSAYPPSSLALLPMSPSTKQPSTKADPDSPNVSPLSPTKVPLSSLSALPMSPPTAMTPSNSTGTVKHLEWPTTPVKTSATSIAPAAATTTPVAQPASPPTSQPPSDESQQPPPPTSAPSAPQPPSRPVCSQCLSCVGCVSEVYRLPRRPLSRRQILEHGARHSLPVLLRALPSAVQACVQAWDEGKGTEARQLLPRMETSAKTADVCDTLPSSSGRLPHEASDTFFSAASKKRAREPSKGANVESAHTAVKSEDGSEQRSTEEQAERTEVDDQQPSTASGLSSSSGGGTDVEIKPEEGAEAAATPMKPAIEMDIDIAH